ncbi:DUF389 domain-containing protein [Paractinoplanes ferrugineus]|uniref:Hydrophobic protein (TIGR00271 family) n=1 Tax=Paractinoplanes ferrugineus TaxID=113564 RepID=A0A919MHY5_9ACTN|nr:DUF389 domain-containing protein [Actinoplanes ferrugineus]GIE15439.1 hypothetical protein Afe05nite_72790 [Actinoplanes ferrugineus]
MLHVRVISPTAVTEGLTRHLTDDEAVTHLMVLDGAAKIPPGDVIEFDVVREGASRVLDDLRGLGLDRDGAIVVERIDTALSASADRAARRVPGLGVDAVVWHEIEHQTGEEATLSASYLAFMIVAMIIAAVGVLLDQPILIVGSMVVGPEFGPLAALCVGLAQRKLRMVRRSVLALGVGFPAGMAATVLAVWLLTAADLVDKSMLLDDRPLTDFIWRPDALSWVIGFLGGVAGILSLTSAKAGTLVGVLISVTTIPAAANAAVALAYGVRAEVFGSTLQLVINVAAIVLGGVLTLTVQRAAWGRPRRSAGQGRKR